MSALSNGDIYNDRDGPLNRFYGQIYYLSILWTNLLKNANRKLYTIYRMVPHSMTLSDVWPGFQGHDIFEVEYRKNGAL